MSLSRSLTTRALPLTTWTPGREFSPPWPGRLPRSKAFKSLQIFLPICYILHNVFQLYQNKLKTVLAKQVIRQCLFIIFFWKKSRFILSKNLQERSKMKEQLKLSAYAAGYCRQQKAILVIIQILIYFQK